MNARNLLTSHNKDLGGAPAFGTALSSAAPIEPQEGLAPDGLQSTGAAGAWVSVDDAMPPEHCPPLLITNNINSRNAFGHMSHVWVAHMLHTSDDEVVAFAHDSDRRIWGITHWAPISPPESGQ